MPPDRARASSLGAHPGVSGSLLGVVPKRWLANRTGRDALAEKALDEATFRRAAELWAPFGAKTAPPAALRDSREPGTLACAVTGQPASSPIARLVSLYFHWLCLNDAFIESLHLCELPRVNALSETHLRTLDAGAESLPGNNAFPFLSRLLHDVVIETAQVVPEPQLTSVIASLRSLVAAQPEEKRLSECRDQPLEDYLKRRTTTIGLLPILRLAHSSPASADAEENTCLLVGVLNDLVGDPAEEVNAVALVGRQETEGIARALVTEMRLHTGATGRFFRHAVAACAHGFETSPRYCPDHPL